MKKGVPPPVYKLPATVNELMNDEVDTVPDVININQNQIGINESTRRQVQQEETADLLPDWATKSREQTRSHLDEFESDIHKSASQV